MNDKTIDWLLQGEPWVEYRTRVDLLDQKESHPQVIAARRAMMADAKIKNLLAGLTDWPGTVLNSHKSASQSFHKLEFIADLGLNINDPPVKKIVDRVMKHQSKEAPFQLPTNVPVHFGGSGEDEWAWAHMPKLRESESARVGVGTLLSLWDESKEKHPYMFFMGTDFRKLKAPLFWYDILHVLDVLSHFEWAGKDKRFRQMLKIVESKADCEGRYAPESIWTAWKDWDFCQKKIPSRGLTFFVQRILKRASAN